MSRNGPADNRASRNIGLMLGCFLIVGCDAPPAQNTATGIASSTVTPVDEAPARVASDIMQNTASVTVAKKLPGDVFAFKTRRNDCDHFRGEDPGDDQARAAELARKLEQTCKGTDAELASLRRRYVNDPGVMAALADYEGSVE